MNPATSFTENGKRIIYLDASAYKEGACEDRLKSIIVDGLREKEFNSPLAFGQACHKFRARLRLSEGNFSEALTEATTYYSNFLPMLMPKDFRTLELLMLVCTLYYQKVYKQDLFQSLVSPLDGKLMIEKRGAFPAAEIFPTTKAAQDELNIEIQICGTLDDIGVLEAGNIVVNDLKTMTAPLYYAPKNLQSYELSIQLMMYKMIAEHLFKLPNVGCRIEAIVLDKESKVKPGFIFSDIMQYSDEDMNHFKYGIHKTIYQICGWFRNNMFAPKNFQCCNTSIGRKENVGLCKRFKICSAKDPAMRAMYLNELFKVDTYNPLTFGEDLN